MKRFEEAELEVVCFRNAVIATSGGGCADGCSSDCTDCRMDSIY